MAINCSWMYNILIKIILENVYETAYSAATWPAINFNIGADCARVLETENFTQEACADYYRENTAYIEVTFFLMYNVSQNLKILGIFCCFSKLIALFLFY